MRWFDPMVRAGVRSSSPTTVNPPAVPADDGAVTEAAEVAAEVAMEVAARLEVST